MTKEKQVLKEPDYKERLAKIEGFMGIPLGDVSEDVDKGLVEKLENIPNKVIRKEIEESQKRREYLLGENKGEIVRIEYKTELPSSIRLTRDDEERARKVLEKLGEKRYSDREREYKIYDTDSEERMWVDGWRKLELRWPEHYASYIDSILLHRNFSENTGELWLSFVRSEDCNEQQLDREAEEILQYINSGLQTNSEKEKV